MDSNTTGKFKPKPPPKPTFEGRLCSNKNKKNDLEKQADPNKSLDNASPAQSAPKGGNIRRDNKPPLMPKPLCLQKPKPPEIRHSNVHGSKPHVVPVLIPNSRPNVPSSIDLVDGEAKREQSYESNILENRSVGSEMRMEEQSDPIVLSSESESKSENEFRTCDTSSAGSSQIDLMISVNCDNNCDSHSFDNINQATSAFVDLSICRNSINSSSSSEISSSSNSISSNRSSISCNSEAETCDIKNNGTSPSVSSHQQQQAIKTSQNEENESKGQNNDSSDFTPTVDSNVHAKLISSVDTSPGAELGSESSDSSFGSFTVLSSDCLNEADKEQNISSFCSSSQDLRNQSFLYSGLNCLKSNESEKSDEPTTDEFKPVEYNHQQQDYNIEKGMRFAIETSTPISVPNYMMDFSTESENAQENSKNIILSQEESVIQDENVEEKSSCNSVENDLNDGSVSVRRRLSTWFGSFGKGNPNKQKEKRESCFFVASDDFMSTLVNSSSPSNEIPDQNLVSVPSCEIENDNSSTLDDQSELSIDKQELSSSLADFTAEIDLPSDKKQRKVFYIAHELMSSEKVFVNVLKLLCYDFKDYIRSCNKDSKACVIPEDELDKVIASLPQLLRLSEDLLQDLENRISSWSKLPKIADVIVKKGPFLKLFSVYIQNFESQCDHLDECCNKYPRFAKALKSFEMSDICKKLSVKHFMLKPVQRIPQYRMFLDNYLAHLDIESEDYHDTQVALEIVSNVADHANTSIKNGDHLCKLLQLQSQLGNYEIIRPWRKFIKEGELCKLSRKENQLRYFILLNDCLLYTSFYGSMTGLRVKYELPLSGMKVTVTPKIEECNTEFSIITSTRSFTLRARSEAECDEWVNALQNAIKENNNRQLTFVNMKFVAKNAAAETIKLGKEAPIWIQDKRVTMCQSCTAEFTVTFRRHHCRACGKVVCGTCSENKAPLRYMKFQTARVCDDCHNYLLKEFEAADSNMFEIIKSELCLSDYDAIRNALEHIRSSFKKQTNSIKKMKKYIPSRLKEVTANDSGSQMSGWMYRRGRRSWKRLWFVLKEQVLYVYRASEDVVAIESIPILGYKIEKVKEGTYDDTDLQNIIQLSHANQRPLVFAVESSHSANRWVSEFQEATVLK